MLCAARFSVVVLKFWLVLLTVLALISALPIASMVALSLLSVVA